MVILPLCLFTIFAIFYTAFSFDRVVQLFCWMVTMVPILHCPLRCSRLKTWLKQLETATELRHERNAKCWLYPEQDWRRLDWEQSTAISHHQPTLGPQAGHIDWGGKVLALGVVRPKPFEHLSTGRLVVIIAPCGVMVPLIFPWGLNHASWLRWEIPSMAVEMLRQKVRLEVMIYPARKWRNIDACKIDHWIQDPLIL